MRENQENNTLAEVLLNVLVITHIKGRQNRNIVSYNSKYEILVFYSFVLNYKENTVPSHLQPFLEIIKHLGASPTPLSLHHEPLL